MFRKKYQSGFLSVLYSCGKSPLELWGMQVKNGFIRRVTDDDVKSLALEIAGTNVTTTYIYCPAERKKVLGVRLAFLIMIVKNLKKYFTFEITVLDDKNMHRRFRFSNFQSTTRIRPFCTSMPIGLAEGWNQIQFNLADFTRRAYGTNYVETTRMQIHANCRIRRIYFADKLYSEEDTPIEYKLLMPVRRKSCVREKPQPAKRPSTELATELPQFPRVVTQVEEGLGRVSSNGKREEVVETAAPAPSEVARFDDASDVLEDSSLGREDEDGDQEEVEYEEVVAPGEDVADAGVVPVVHVTEDEEEDEEQVDIIDEEEQYQEEA